IEGQMLTTGPVRDPLQGWGIEQKGYLSHLLVEVPPDASFDFTLWGKGLFRDVQIGGPYKAQTPPSPGHPFRFLAFGDSGNGSNTQRGVAERMIATTPDLIIHLGDLVYPAGLAEDYQRNFFEPYHELLARIPFMPTLGNHDVATNRGQPFLDVFEL